MRIVFCGTPDFAVPSLEMLINKGYNIVAVFAQPDRPAGRKKQLRIPATKQVASKYGIPIYQFERIRDQQASDKLRELKPDLMITAAFGQIFSEENLQTPPLGCINVHGSLLPKYRGAAPIQWAILDGLQQTGVTTLYTVMEVDAGDMLIKKKLDIFPNETAGELFERMGILGAQALYETLVALENGTLKPQAQDINQVTHCRMLKKEDGQIDWSKSAQNIHNMIRGFNPWPIAYSYLVEDDSTLPQMIKIISSEWMDKSHDKLPGDIIIADAKEGLFIATGKGVIQILELQMAGKKRMNVQQYLLGHSISSGKLIRWQEQDSGGKSYR